MVGSTGKCNLKIHVRNLGYPSPTNRGPKTTLSAISQLKGNFNCLYIRKKNDIHKRASALQTTRGLESAISSLNEMNFAGFKVDRSFYHPP